jgi:hypothetical protein
MFYHMKKQTCLKHKSHDTWSTTRGTFNKKNHCVKVCIPWANHRSADAEGGRASEHDTLYIFGLLLLGKMEQDLAAAIVGEEGDVDVDGDDRDEDKAIGPVPCCCRQT